MSVTAAPPEAPPDAEGPEPPHEAAATGVLAWLTTTDHKRIGLSYMVTSSAFFLFGGVLAMLMRAELAQPGLDVTSADTYNELFTMHGSIMMFLFIGPFAFGLANYL
ncbi:MAG: cbb3-type cytochrome c oxidase subunit I, partial [Actinomycetota bacterium]|nr:cbb3-type cytochrome c oxidase subunit I [Actinomycetota bacterium]